MENVVLFCEKPSQAKAFADAYVIDTRGKGFIKLKPCDRFPNGATVTWGIGHLVDMAKPKSYNEDWNGFKLEVLPMLPNHVIYEVSADKKEQFAVVKKLFNQSNVVLYNCTDAGREGSNIFYRSLIVSGAKPIAIKRVWCKSLVKEEIRKAVDNPLSEEFDRNLFKEAEARAIGDWKVGMNGTILYTLLLQKVMGNNSFKGALSVGRVVTPLVTMVNERNNEILNFTPQSFYDVEAVFTTKEGYSYRGKSELKRTLNKSEAEDFLLDNNLEIGKKKTGIVGYVETTMKETLAPKLHSLSTLQTKANRLWKISPSTTLKIVQKLYEGKLTSYPRSDCQYITEAEYEYLANNVSEYQSVLGVEFEATSPKNKKRYVNEDAVTDHYAIITTNKIPTATDLEALSENERNIYFEVVRSVLAMFHRPYQYSETEVVTNIGIAPFKTIGKTEVDKGFKLLWKDDDVASKKTKGDAENMLPPLSEYQEVVGITELREGLTTVPKPFTEGQLITVMKTSGNSKYFNFEEGEAEQLKNVEGIGTEATRSSIIDNAKKVGFIEVTRNNVLITEKGRMIAEAVKGTLLGSPAMTARWEKFLNLIGKGKGQQIDFIEGIDKFVTNLVETAPNGILENLTIKESAKKIVEQQFLGDCPYCNGGKVVERKQFYGCTNYSNEEIRCSFTIPSTLLEKRITTTQAKKLISKGKTDLVKGFKSKKGKSFNAYIVLDNTKKSWKFEFK